jgi:hypothetical protein
MNNKELANLTAYLLILKAFKDLDNGKESEGSFCLLLGSTLLAANKPAAQSVTNYAANQSARGAFINKIEPGHSNNTAHNNGKNDNELPVSVTDKTISGGSDINSSLVVLPVSLKVQFKQRLSLAGIYNSFKRVKQFRKQVFFRFSRVVGVFNFRHKHKNSKQP